MSKTNKAAEFHKHLDERMQCALHPHNLCPIGSQMNKQLTITAKKLVEQKIAECRDCGGLGVTKGDNGDGVIVDPTPCSTCADLRKLAGELCWHDYSGFWQITCKHCGMPHQPYFKGNPTYTIQSLRKLLERMGEWEDFKIWIEGEYQWEITVDHMDILTSDELMAQAVLEYLKERIK